MAVQVPENQLYVFAKQHKRIDTIVKNGNVDYIVTDSPLLLSKIYGKGKFPTQKSEQLFMEMVDEINNSYNNMNIYLERNPDINFEQQGRIQNEEQSKQIDNQILEMLKDHEYSKFINNDMILEKILFAFLTFRIVNRPKIDCIDLIFRCED